MLERLDIRNFALIDRASLIVKPGFSVISGETGAGKSLLIGAIGAVMGARVGKDLVQTGADRAIVEAAFSQIKDKIPSDLWSELSVDEDDILILTREIEAGGRTWCRINGRLVSLSLLKQVSAHLMDIHGQNENQKLFNAASHKGLLDLFGGAAVESAVRDYRLFWEKRRSLKEKLGEFGVSSTERERDLDLLRYQVREIRTVAPRENEDRKLQKHRDLQEHAERVTANLSTVLNLLTGQGAEGGALAEISQAVSLIEKTTALQPAVGAAWETLSTCQDLLYEALSEIRGVAEETQYNPQLLDKIDARLDVLHRLKKKYGPEIDDVFEFARQAEEKIHLLEDSETQIQELGRQLAESETALRDRAVKLTVARAAAGERLSTEICRQLSALGMKDARFAVDLSENMPQIDGMDSVEFLLSPNKGEPLKALAKIASGGEAARIMLAIKLILATEDQTPLLIFDEVDAGVSGRTSELVGQKLLELSSHAQVFCVTHTAQIAALADHHMLIKKRHADQRTLTEIYELNEADRVQEVARLLSGETATTQAVELAVQLRAAKQATGAGHDRMSGMGGAQ